MDATAVTGRPRTLPRGRAAVGLLTRHRELAWGALLGGLAFAAYMIGSNRGFGYDEAVSFAYAIATPNFFDALGGSAHGPYTVPYAIGTNDHVLLSVIGHAIYSLTQVRDEWVYRLVPALCAGATVGIVAAWLRARFSALTALAVTLFVATNPLLVEQARQARGYAIAVLLCVIATLICSRSPLTRGRLAVYALVVALAGSAQLFAVCIVPLHVAAALVTNRRRAWQVLVAGSAGAVVAVLVNSGPIWTTFHSDHLPARWLQPLFVPTLPLYLLGATALWATGVWLSTFVLGLAAGFRERAIWAALATTVAVAAVLAYVVQPPFLYPRFFLFLIPGAAYVIAKAVQRWPLVLVPLAFFAAGYAAWSQSGAYTMPEYPLREAAAIIDQTAAAGQTACLLSPDYNTIPAYTTRFRYVSSSAELQACDVVLLPAADANATLKAEAVATFPHHRELKARIPGYVLWR